MIKRQDILEFLTDALLVGNAGALVYLYFARAWYDPYVPVVVVELAIMIGTIGLGIWRFIFYIQKRQRL